MCHKVICWRKSLVTLAAGKHLLSCMRVYVSLKVRCMRESFVIMVAGKYLLSCVAELACFEVNCQRESFVTLVTNKYHLSCIRELVCLSTVSTKPPFACFQPTQNRISQCTLQFSLGSFFGRIVEALTVQKYQYFKNQLIKPTT